jgi:hypothetical protein
MLELLSHQCFSALLGIRARLHVPAQLAATGRPDFDLSDFDEPPSTVPGGYWHETSADHCDDATASCV